MLSYKLFQFILKHSNKMLNCFSGSFLNVINLANSIIGVSILAMPYCFQKCGILLSIALIILSGILVRISCYLLLKCSIMARRRNFENLAFHALGSTGKLAVEIGIIGFLIGVCIAFFVVIGDLGPPLASQYMMVENNSNLRAELLVFLGFFVALPLGLLKNVNSLTSLSAFSIAFYVWLVLKIFSEATTELSLNEWWYQVNWWQLDGLLPCLPIFSMALSCQTQLFECFDVLNEPTLKRMMSVVNGAVYLCSAVYILVGFFGYVACHDKTITGNILINLTPSVITECIKLLFVFTVVISFPLCLFPCRTSLHSMLFKQGLSHHDMAVNFIPDHRFRAITISLVIVTIGVAIMIPNIEFALGIIGSTVGTMICLIFPAVLFIHDTNKSTTEKRMAQVVMFVGMFILVACTYSTLQEKPRTRYNPESVKNSIDLPHADSGISFSSTSKPINKAEEIIKKIELEQERSSFKEKEKIKNIIEIAIEKRLEPPIPLEPEQAPVKISNQKVDLDPQAIQKEDKEIQREISLPSGKILDNQLKDKQVEILRRLEEQQTQQKIIIEQQQKVLKELIKHQESHDDKAKEILESNPQAPLEPESKVISENIVPNPKPEDKILEINISPKKVESAPQVVSVNSDSAIPVKDSKNVNVSVVDVPKIASDDTIGGKNEQEIVITKDKILEDPVSVAVNSNISLDKMEQNVVGVLPVDKSAVEMNVVPPVVKAVDPSLDGKPAEHVHQDNAEVNQNAINQVSHNEKSIPLIPNLNNNSDVQRENIPQNELSENNKHEMR